MSEEAVESLSEILSGPRTVETPTAEPVKAEAAPAAAEPKVEAPKVARDESGKFAKTTETDPAAVKPAEPVLEKPAEKPRADVAAIIDERRKRQAAEARLAEYEKAAPVKAPSVFDDEEGAIRSRVDQQTAPLREMLFNMSLKSARSAYKEQFEEAQEGFLEATTANPRLMADMRASSDPGEFIYRQGLFHKKLSAVGGDLLKFEEQVTATTRGELDALKAQYDAVIAENAQLKKTQTDLENLPRSLNNRSSAAAPKGEIGDEEDIKSIARFGKPQTR